MSSELRRLQVTARLLVLGWSSDGVGGLYRDQSNGRPMRVKLKAKAARIDVKSVERDHRGRKPWLRIGGAYYSEVRVFEDGKVRIGSTIF